MAEIYLDTREFLLERNRRKIVVHTIAFQSLDGRLILKQIAEDNGGTFRFVPGTSIDFNCIRNTLALTGT